MKKKAKFKKDRMVTCMQKRLKIKSLLNGMEVTCKQKTAYEISACLVGSEMCIRDRYRTQW